MLNGEVFRALREMEDALQRVLDVRPVIDWTRLDLWMKNPNLGQEINPGDLEGSLVICKYADVDIPKISDRG